MKPATAILILHTHQRSSTLTPTATAISLVLFFVLRMQLNTRINKKKENKRRLIVTVADAARLVDSRISALQNIGITIFSRLFFKSSTFLRALKP